MKKHRGLVVAAACLLLSGSLWGTVIKIGSIAPTRSPWDDSLNTIAREWGKISNGTIVLKVYPNGIAGTEQDMIRKLRLGTLDGAVFTNMGMTKINPNLYALNAPFLMETKEEFEYVFDRMAGVFLKPIEEKGYKLLFRSLAGWVYFFASGEFAYPEDLKKFKISFTTGEPDMEQAFKKMGYQVIPNEMKDVMMALQSGMVNCIYYPPLVAASAQFFALTPHMLHLPVSPLIGWMVLTDKAWQSIPEALREPMLEAVRKEAEGLYPQTIKLEQEALKVMKENGLVVHEPAADAMARWRAASLKGMEDVAGKAYSKDILDQVLALLREFRAKNGR
ncbi:MAG: TRAP transporter substrate-binding protein DctP [Candidatus Aminicenantales bacterium]